MKHKVDLKILFYHAIDVNIYPYLPNEYKKKTYEGNSKYEVALKNNFNLKLFLSNYLAFQKGFFKEQNILKIDSKISYRFNLFVLYKLVNSILRDYFKIIELNPHLSIDKIARELNTQIDTEMIESELILFNSGYGQKLYELERSKIVRDKKISKTQNDKTAKNEPVYIMIINAMLKLNINLKQAADAISSRLLEKGTINKDLSKSYQTQIVKWAKKQIKRNLPYKKLALEFFNSHDTPNTRNLFKK